jgi:hypothetical protein
MSYYTILHNESYIKGGKHRGQEVLIGDHQEQSSRRWKSGKKKTIVSIAYI